MTPKPWYHKGLRFECTCSGNCCTSRGEYAWVNLTEADVAAIAGLLGLSREDFLSRYCDKRPGYHPSLRSGGPDCPFLTEDRRCRIYAARPMQCRTWPFWKENLHRDTWEGPVRTSCPGIGRGRVHTIEEIDATAQANEDWYDRP